MTRRALLIAYDFPPVSSAAVYRTVRFVKYLANHRWEPIVLTASLEPGDESGRQLMRQVPPGTPVERIGRGAKPAASARQPDRGATKRSVAKRWLRQSPPYRIFTNTWQLATETPDRQVRWVGPAVRAGREAIRKYRPDLLYTSGPPHSVHLVGRSLQRSAGLPWVMDFRDPWARPDWARRRNQWGAGLAGWFERACVRRADAVVLNTPAAEAEFRSAYPRERSEKFQAIPNGCNADLARQVEAILAERPAARDQTIRLLHPGSCYNLRDPRPVVDAVAELARLGRRVRFEQVGPCGERFQLGRYAAERGVADLVSVEPSVPHDEILRRMAAADILLILQPGTSLQVPGKLYEMLPFRKPIVAITEQGATADLIRRYRLGGVAPSSDAAALVRMLAELVDQSDGHAAARESDVDEALREFDGDALTGRLARVFDAALERHRGVDSPAAATNVFDPATA